MTQNSPEAYGERHRTHPPSNRAARFINVGRTLAGVYLGYKTISLREKRKGAAWGESKREAHHLSSARRFYATDVKNQACSSRPGSSWAHGPTCCRRRTSTRSRSCRTSCRLSPSV